MVQDIIKQLQIIVNFEGEDVTYNTIARVILENIQKGAEDISIQKLADLCYTSPSTISRFVKKLGYSNFNEFKLTCARRRVLGKEILSDKVKTTPFNSGADKGTLVELTDSICSSLREFVELLDMNEVDKLIQMIHDHKEVYFFGFHLTGYFMQQLQYDLFSMGKYVKFSLQETGQERLAIQTDQDSLSVIFSVDGNYLRQKSKLFYSLKDRGGKIALVTQNPALKQASQCDYVNYLGKYHSPMEGNYKMHMFTDIMINRYYQKYCK